MTRVMFSKVYVAVTVVFLLVLECGVFAGHVQYGGRQSNSGPTRYSRESILHFRSDTDTSAHRSAAFPSEIIPDSGSDKKRRKKKKKTPHPHPNPPVRTENGDRGEG